MLKTILISSPGFDSDRSALETAYLIGRPFEAHLECLFVRATPATLALRASVQEFPTPNPDMALFAALAEAENARRIQAFSRFQQFCDDWSIPLAASPNGSYGVTASWREVEGAAADLIIGEGRYRDLVVMGRAPTHGLLSVSDMGAVLVGCGRPMVIAPPAVPEFIGSTIAIAWKDTPEAAGAMTAASELISRASRIVILTAEEKGGSPHQIASAERLADQLRWRGADIEVRRVLPEERGVPDAVLGTARALGADLLVMGGYSHSRARELLFGGFTQHVLAASPLPVFLFH